MTVAEFGGSKARGIQTSSLIHHLLQRGTVDSFAEDGVKVWWVGAGAAELKVYFSSLMLEWALLMGRARRGEPQSLFLHSLEQPFAHSVLWCQGNQWLWPWDERWTAAQLLLWPKSRNSKRPLNSPDVLWQKTTQSSPVLFSFAGVLHKPQDQSGESFIQTPAAAAFYLAFFEEPMESSQQVLSTRWAKDCQSRQQLHNTLTVSLWKHPKTPHSSSLLSP